jgi:DNA mismatch repair protein MSH2
LELLGNEDNFGQFKFKTHSHDEFMKLDAGAVDALNLVPAPNDNGNRKNCLTGVLNTCLTPQGRQPSLISTRAPPPHKLVDLNTPTSS